MTLTHFGPKLGQLANDVPMLDANAPAVQTRPVAPSRILGLGLLAAFMRSRELRQRIKFAAQAQSSRLR
jgi:hypothetical protein